MWYHGYCRYKPGPMTHFKVGREGQILKFDSTHGKSNLKTKILWSPLRWLAAKSVPDWRKMISKKLQLFSNKKIYSKKWKHGSCTPMKAEEGQSWLQTLIKDSTRKQNWSSSACHGGARADVESLIGLYKQKQQHWLIYILVLFFHFFNISHTCPSWCHRYILRVFFFSFTAFYSSFLTEGRKSLKTQCHGSMKVLFLRSIFLSWSSSSWPGSFSRKNNYYVMVA